MSSMVQKRKIDTELSIALQMKKITFNSWGCGSLRSLHQQLQNENSNKKWTIRVILHMISDESIANNKPSVTLRKPVFMPHDSARKDDMFEMMIDRSQRSKCRIPKCNALTV
ncbi:hypothetical protein NPIL_479681 [Nephila pilipes]|uniref:Uncharacterized protein n=1 Tax=Nephila pilipes TaxID=299642 RepID=A0A8X6P817_NEPPI|nr:hypothetical protein NPIL_479681 [Nephila pilipes]